MSQKKPIKLEEGSLKEFKPSDELPNQPDINEVKELVSCLVKELIQIGLPISDIKLLKLLK
jgi:hypothetical protein